MLSTARPDLALQWHPTLNGGLKPEDVSYGSLTKAYWVCPKDTSHIWKTRIHLRTSFLKTGCPWCYHRGFIPYEASLATLYPDIAAEFHPTKNDPLTPGQVAPFGNTLLWWKCRECFHEWSASITNRVCHRTDCPACCKLKHKRGTRMTTAAPHLLKEFDKEQNPPDLDPEKIKYGSGRKLHWRCLKNPDHRWQAVVFSRVRGSGCPYCP
mmetsp:Transcript_35050/g.56723  ORF Transcript_35050/g.56723 Transcript_35050/m.56723 type:complete len:210 (+) Transcript_35050:377-1006(+)